MLPSRGGDGQTRAFLSLRTRRSTSGVPLWAWKATAASRFRKVYSGVLRFTLVIQMPISLLFVGKQAGPAPAQPRLGGMSYAHRLVLICPDR